MWVRGLKLCIVLANSSKVSVAPRVGAWIETQYYALKSQGVESHPVWVRGLKQKFTDKVCNNGKSHPVWVRGLKHRLVVIFNLCAPSHPVWVRGLKLTDVGY